MQNPPTHCINPNRKSKKKKTKKMRWKTYKWLGVALICVLSSCARNHSDQSETSSSGASEPQEHALKMRIITTEELNNLDEDTLRIWENGGFLGRQKISRDYRHLLSGYLQKERWTAQDIEMLYPRSVEEMNLFFSRLTSGDEQISEKMRTIDTLMTYYADMDSLSCLSLFLNMYFYMDPRVIDRDWMGDWNLNQAQYGVIADNKESFRKYYETLDPKYEWLTRDWVYAYQNY